MLDKWELARSGDPPANWYWQPATTAQSGVVPLTDVARVGRGLATGANAFFFLTDAGAAYLPATVLVPAVPSLRHFDGRTLARAAHAAFGGPNQRRWLLVLDADGEMPDAVRLYVEAHAAEYSKRHLCEQRPRWWAITDLPAPDLLLSPLSKGGFKVVVNAVQAVPSNNLIGISVKVGDPGILAEWLRSSDGQSELLRVSRRYHGGSHKLEPGDLRRVLLPAHVGRALAAPVPMPLEGPPGRRVPSSEPVSAPASSRT